MAGNRKFHNKFHSANHHTLPSPHIVDSGLDPIASHDFPFIGDFVLNGTVSSSNNYTLNDGGRRSTNLDTIPHGLPAPSGWNVFRDSTYIDGDVTITGNLSAFGELTYLHTQVYTTSATEIIITSDNSNGKTAALEIDQYGTNDLVDIKNDGISTLLITGSASNSEVLGGWIGVNLGNLPNVDRPNQRMTIVGSVSVVPDPIDSTVDYQRVSQSDPGVTGSLYIEGGLHVNDTTFLDQLTVDTTDGDAFFYGTNRMHITVDPGVDIDTTLDVDEHTQLDQLTVDTDDGKTLFEGNNEIHITVVPGVNVDTTLDVDEHTRLDQLTVDTDDGKTLIEGDNKLHITVDPGVDIDTTLDVDEHTQLDQLTVNTDDGDMLIEGSNKLLINTQDGVDIDTHTQLDQLTVNTDDGDTLFHGENRVHITTEPGLDIDTFLDVDEHTNLDQLTVNTDDGETYFTGENQVRVDVTDGVNIDTTLDVDEHTQLDQLTVNTDDGETLITGQNQIRINTVDGVNVDTTLDVDEHTQLDQLTVNTDDGETYFTGNNQVRVDVTDGVNVDTTLDVDEHTNLDQLTVNTDDGETLITGQNQVRVNVVNGVNIDTTLDVDGHTQLDQLTVDTTDGTAVIEGSNPLDVKTHAHLDQLTVDTTDGPTQFTGSGDVNIDSTQGFNVVSDTNLSKLTVDTNSGQTLIRGTNGLEVTTHTYLNKLTVDTDDDKFLIHGNNILDVNTDSNFKGTTVTAERVNVETSFNNNLTVNGGGLFDVYVQTMFDDEVVFNSALSASTKNSPFEISNPLPWASMNKFEVGVPSTFESLTASSEFAPIVFNGDNKTIMATPVVFTNETPLSIINADVSGVLNVTGNTLLNGATIDNSINGFTVNGTRTSVFNTDVLVNSNVHITGDIRVDGNAYLSAGPGGNINVGDSDVDNVIFNADILSDIRPNSDILYSLGTSGKRWKDLFVKDITTTNLETEHARINQTLYVGGPSELYGRLFVDNDIYSTGKLTVEGEVNFQDELNVTGNTFIGGSVHVDNQLYVSQEAEFDSGVVISDNLHVTGNVIVDGEVVLNSGVGSTVKIGDENTDSIVLMSKVSGAIIPRDTDQYDIGQFGEWWNNLYVNYAFVRERVIGTHATFSGTVDVNTDLNVDGHTQLDRTTISTNDGQFTVSGFQQTYISTSVDIDNDVDIDGHTQLDQLTVDTTDGKFLVSGENIFDVDVATELDQVTIHTTDGPMSVSGENDLNIDTNINTNGNFNIVGQISAMNGPWIFNSCDLLGYNPGSIHEVTDEDQLDGSIENAYFSPMPFHPFQVECNSLFTRGVTALGPVQIGNLPEDFTDELQEPTFEVLGNMHLRDGNLKIVSDIRHLDDENTLMRFVPDGISFIAGDAELLKLTESSEEFGNDLVEIGTANSPADLKLYKTRDGGGPSVIYESTSGTTTFNEPVNFVETISGRNLIVDFLTVHDQSFGNVGGGLFGSSTMSVLSGIAKKGHITNNIVQGANQPFEGTEIGVTYDLTQDSQKDMQNFFSLTFEALEADPSIGVEVGDVQTVNYHIVTKWDDFYSEAFVNEVESGLVYTSTNPFATVTAVVLSATEVPTTERIVKIVVKPEVETLFLVRNVLTQDKPQRLSTVATADFDIDGDLTVRGDQLHLGNSEIAGELTVRDNVYIHGDLHVDGNTFLSGGVDGSINVGDVNTDNIRFRADIDSNFTPDLTNTFDLGATFKRWRNLYTGTINTSGDILVNQGDQTILDGSINITNGDINVTGGDINTTNSVNWNGGNSNLSNSVYSSVCATSAEWDSVYSSVCATSANWDSTHASVLATSAEWDSVYSSVCATSAEWDSVYSSVCATSGNWDSTHNSVLTTSGNWDSTHASVLATSAEWDSVYSSVLATSTNWDSTHASVLATSSNWDSTHASVLATSGNWDSTHASVCATSANWDSTYESVLTTSGDWDSTYESVLTTSGDWDSTYESVLATSGDWDSVYAFVNSDSATNNTSYNRNTFVNVSGDTITGDLDVVGTLSGTNAIFTSITAISSFVDVIDIKVRELSGYDIIDGDLSVQGNVTTEKLIVVDEPLTDKNIQDFKSTHNSVHTTSSNWDSTHASVLATSSNWDSTHASVLATSSNWDSTHASVLATSANWDSTHASVLTTSAEWDSTYASVLATSGNWDSTHASVLATSAEWDSTYDSVCATSGNWDSTHASVLATSGNWDSTHASVLATSGNWDSTHASVCATSAEWDSVYSYINTTSGDLGFTHLSAAKDGSLYLRDDQVPPLAITNVFRVENPSLVSPLQENIRRGDIVIVTSTEENLIAIVDYPAGDFISSIAEYVGYEKLFAPGNMVRFINGLQGPSVDLTPDHIEDEFSDHKFVSQTQKDSWDSTHSSVLTTSAEWDSVYSFVKGDSATNNTHYNRNTFVNVSGDTITGNLDVVGTLSGTNAIFTSITALSSYVDVIDIKVRELSGYDIIDGDLNVQGITTAEKIVIAEEPLTNKNVQDFKSTHNSVLTTSGNWDSVYTDVKNISSSWSDWESTYQSVLTTSGDWDSTHNSVLTTSAEWDSTYDSVCATSGNWDSTYDSVLATSGNWDSTHNSVLTTSGNWDSTHASVLATSGNWDSTHSSVLATSAEWDSTYDSVCATSGNWDSVYSFVNSDSATNNTHYNRNTFVNVSGDTITGGLDVVGTLSGTNAIFTSITALSSFVDVIDIKVRELSGYDIIDGDLNVQGITTAEKIFIVEEPITDKNIQDFKSTHNSVLTTSGNWDSTHASVLATSAEWDSVYSSVCATSANWDSTHNSVLTTSGNWDSTHSSVLTTSAEWDSTYDSVCATSGNWDSTHSSVLTTSGNWDSTHASVLATSAEWDSTYDSVCATSGNWDSTHSSVLATSSNWDSTYDSVCATSGNWDSTHASVLATSANWDSTHNSVFITSGNWDSTHSSVLATSGNWDSTHASVFATSGNWDSTHSSVLTTSATWDSVYNFVNTTSGTGQGYAVLDAEGKVLESQIPNLSISEIYTVGNAAGVELLCNNSSSYGDVDIERGDVVIVTTPPHTLIAAVDNPAGIWTDNSGDPGNTDTFDGFVKVTTPTDYVFSVNGKNGYQIILNPDDLDDTNTAHKFVTALQRVQWDSVYSFVNSDSATNNTHYNRNTFVNVSGDTITGDLHIQGDLRVDGNTYLSAGTDGIINIGDTNTDNVVFHSDVNSNIIPNTDVTFDIGTNEQQWRQLFIQNVSATNDIYIDNNLGVSGHGTIQDATINDTLLTLGDTTLSGILNVKENTTLHSDLTVSGNTFLSGNNVTLGDTTLSGTLDVKENTTLHSDLTVSGNTFLSGHMTLSGDQLTLGDTTLSGTLDVEENAILHSDLTVLNNTFLSGTLAVEDDIVFNSDLHIKGDLRVDGNTYLSAGIDGIINVGDKDTDNVVFHADVDSSIIPDTTETHDLGTADKEWNTVYAHDLSASNDLDVLGVTTLSGKSDHRGAGLIIKGTPTGIHDAGAPGFVDKVDDYMFPDVDITGDTVMHGSLSADEAFIYSLTASKFRAEYQKMVINDGDFEMHNGNFRQRGGNVLIDSDIGHIDDENTFIRFQPDQIQFVCHDLNMITFNEYPAQDDIIIIGDAADAIDLRVQNPTDESTFFIDGDTAFVGIGTNNPIEKLHVYHGNAQFAPGDRDGAVMITSGDSNTRVNKTGSIRWNSEVNRYEGYLDHLDQWASFTSIGDTDGDTYIDVDAESNNYGDSDRMAFYTAGCSAMALYPDSTVAFAGDIRFDNVTIYDSNNLTGPISATSEFLYLSINGKMRAIRLWDTPEDYEHDVRTIHGENIAQIGDDCALGLEGLRPVQTIDARPQTLSDPLTEKTAPDTDADTVIDAFDPDDDDDKDNIPDYADADHYHNRNEPDTDGDGIIDRYDNEDFPRSRMWDHGIDTYWDTLNTEWQSLSDNGFFPGPDEPWPPE